MFFFPLSLLFDSCCSLYGRSLAATLATLTRSSPRWWWSWRQQTNSSSWTWTRTSSRASPTPTPSSSFRSEEFLRDSALAQLRSSTDSSSIPSHAPVPSQASSESKLDNIYTTYVQIFTLYGFRCCFSVGPVDRPAMVSRSARLQGIQSDGESVVVCTCSADQQSVFTWFSSLWPLAPSTFHDQYVRYVFTHVSAGCSWKDHERTDVLPESVLILVLSSKWHKKRQLSPRPLSDCDIQQSLFNLLCFYGTVCAVG